MFIPVSLTFFRQRCIFSQYQKIQRSPEIAGCLQRCFHLKCMNIRQPMPVYRMRELTPSPPGILLASERARSCRPSGRRRLRRPPRNLPLGTVVVRELAVPPTLPPIRHRLRFSVLPSPVCLKVMLKKSTSVRRTTYMHGTLKLYRRPGRAEARSNGRILVRECRQSLQRPVRHLCLPRGRCRGTG